MTEIAGIFFDCDGTLADTMPSHDEAWMTVLDRYGLEMSEDRSYELCGWPTAITELLAAARGMEPGLKHLAGDELMEF